MRTIILALLFLPRLVSAGGGYISGELVGVTRGGTGTSTSFTSGSVIFSGASGIYSQKNANFFWDNTNNRLGIGTASPNTALTVVGTSSNTVVLADPGSASAPSFAFTNGTNTGIYSSAANTLSMSVNGNARWAMDNTNFGGDNNAVAVLSFNTPSATTANIQTRRDTTTTGIGGATGTLSLITNGSSRALIDNSGNIGFGTTTPTTKLHMSSGTFTVDGNTQLVANFGGTVRAWSRTKAQIDSLTPGAAGEMIFCSDCSTANLCVSTGTAVAQWRRVDSATAGCGSGN